MKQRNLSTLITISICFILPLPTTHSYMMHFHPIDSNHRLCLPFFFCPKCVFAAATADVAAIDDGGDQHHRHQASIGDKAEVYSVYMCTGWMYVSVMRVCVCVYVLSADLMAMCEPIEQWGHISTMIHTHSCRPMLESTRADDPLLWSPNDWWSTNYTWTGSHWTLGYNIARVP